MEQKELNQEQLLLLEKLKAVQTSIESVVLGYSSLTEKLLISLVCNQHSLLEGVPGLAKTLMISTLSQAVDLPFQRIQFTPDLLPADLLGTLIYNPASGEFSTKKGPLFTSLIVADEINRAPAKVQSALLEAMQERQITLGDTTYPLDDPFLVLATQNPIDQEGTYPLPEAQVDRFMMKLLLSYPHRDDEVKILETHGQIEKGDPVEPAISKEEILAIRKEIDTIYTCSEIKEYIVDIVRATRTPSLFGLDIDPLIRHGVSPRGGLALLLGSKAKAFLEGRSYVIPDDVKHMVPDILRHRVILSYEGLAEGESCDSLLERILSSVPITYHND